MSNHPSKVHKVTAATQVPIPRRGGLALRKSRLVRRRLRQLFYTVGFVASAAAIGQASYGFLMEAPYLNVKTPVVTGVSPDLSREVLGLVSSLTKGGKNILAIDAGELAEQIGRHPRIRDIKVEKIYPDQLRIQAAERQETALLATDKGFYLVDTDSHVMEQVAPQHIADAKLPYITGLRSDEVNEGEPIRNASLVKALNLLQVLKERNPDLYSRVSEINIATDGVSQLENLTVHLKQGLDIRFGDTNPIEKLAQLETLLMKLENEQVNPYEDLVYIEMKFQDMAVYMDRETAMDIDLGRYDELEKQMEEEKIEYEKKHPIQMKIPDDDEPDNGNTRRESTRPKAKSTPAARNNTSGRNPVNYQRYPQQNYPQQYNQPGRPGPAGQNPPLYNLPANQPR